MWEGECEGYWTRVGIGIRIRISILIWAAVGEFCVCGTFGALWLCCV